MKKIKNILFAALIFVSSSLGPLVSVVAVVRADSKDAVCIGANVENGAIDCDTDAAGDAVSGVIKVAIRIFQAVIGIISLFVLFMAGLGYITSGGDSGKTKTAKDRILYAVIGLVVVGLAQVIISFVLTRVDSANTPVVTPPTAS